jgi:hypothetical protein
VIQEGEEDELAATADELAQKFTEGICRAREMNELLRKYESAIGSQKHLKEFQDYAETEFKRLPQRVQESVKEAMIHLVNLATGQSPKRQMGLSEIPPKILQAEDAYAILLGLARTEDVINNVNKMIFHCGQTPGDSGQIIIEMDLAFLLAATAAA